MLSTVSDASESEDGAADIWGKLYVQRARAARAKKIKNERREECPVRAGQGLAGGREERGARARGRMAAAARTGIPGRRVSSGHGAQYENTINHGLSTI
jgi:hypothetical protein